MSWPGLPLKLFLFLWRGFFHIGAFWFASREKFSESIATEEFWREKQVNPPTAIWILFLISTTMIVAWQLWPSGEASCRSWQGRRWQPGGLRGSPSSILAWLAKWVTGLGSWSSWPNESQSWPRWSDGTQITACFHFVSPVVMAVELYICVTKLRQFEILSGCVQLWCRVNTALNRDSFEFRPPSAGLLLCSALFGANFLFDTVANAI